MRNKCRLSASFAEFYSIWKLFLDNRKKDLIINDWTSLTEKLSAFGIEVFDSWFDSSILCLNMALIVSAQDWKRWILMSFSPIKHLRTFIRWRTSVFDVMKYLKISLIEKVGWWLRICRYRWRARRRSSRKDLSTIFHKESRSKRERATIRRNRTNRLCFSLVVTVGLFEIDTSPAKVHQVQ